MIEPFQAQPGASTSIRKPRPAGTELGCSSYGYEPAPFANEFLIFRHVPGRLMKPKRFNNCKLEPAALPTHDEDRPTPSFFGPFLRPGCALERLAGAAQHQTVICLGKSTYARLGIIVNSTARPKRSWGWHPHLEFSNSSGADCRIYAKTEGICPVLFFEGDPMRHHLHAIAKGKYQDQPERDLARM